VIAKKTVKFQAFSINWNFLQINQNGKSISVKSWKFQILLDKEDKLW